MTYEEGAGMGPFSSQVGTSCKADELFHEEMPTAFKLSRAFGLVGYAFHWVALLTVMALEAFTFCKMNCTGNHFTMLWKLVRVWIVVALPCSIMVFATFFDELCTADLDFLSFTCAPGPAGIIAIVNVFVLVALIVVSGKTDAPTLTASTSTTQPSIGRKPMDQDMAV